MCFLRFSQLYVTLNFRSAAVLLLYVVGPIKWTKKVEILIYWFIDLHLLSLLMEKKRGRRVEFGESANDEPNWNPFTFHWKMEMVEDELQNFKSLSHKVFQVFFFISSFFSPQLQSAHFRISIELKREKKGFRSTLGFSAAKGGNGKSWLKSFLPMYA